MAITIGPVTLPRSAAELLDTTDGYGAGAKAWLESGTSASGPWSTITSETIVSGVEAIYFRDPAGTSSTYYRTWLSKSDGSQASDHSAAFLVGSLLGYTDLFRAKTYLGITDEVDDARLPLIVNAVNAEMIRRTGLFIGPSTDTVRTYDGNSATRNGRRLWIPGGITSMTQVRVAAYDGASYETAVLGDFLLRPYSHLLRPGQAYQYIDAIEVPTGSLSGFWPGHLYEITGAFGPAVPDDLASLADMLITRMWADRNAGSLSAPTASKFIFPDDDRMLTAYRMESFAGVG